MVSTLYSSLSLCLDFLHLPYSNSLLRCVSSFGYEFCLNNLHAVSRPVNLRHGEAALVKIEIITCLLRSTVNVSHIPNLRLEPLAASPPCCPFSFDICLLLRFLAGPGTLSPKMCSVAVVLIYSHSIVQGKMPSVIYVLARSNHYIYFLYKILWIPQRSEAPLVF